VSTVKQVAREDPGGLLAQERPPGGGRRSWRWVEPVAAKHGADRGRGRAHVETEQLALDPLVAPARVLPRQANDQLLELLIDWWPSRSAVWIGPPAGDQPPGQRISVSGVIMKQDQRFGAVRG